VAVSSCTAALHLALVVAGIGAGDEVLCPSLSFIATANAIVHAGGIPVFVDVDEQTYNIDPQCIESAITSKTRAILVVHQIGLPAAVDEITDIARRHGLIVIEDAACAIGAEYKGRRIGTPLGLMACFSFHPRKILTTGEGGMVTTAHQDLAARLRRLRQHAMSVSDVARHTSSTVVIERYDEIGYNYRMTDLQAALGLVQLARLDTMLERRRALARRYSDAFSDLPWMTLPCEPADRRHNYQSYMVRLAGDAPISRDRLMQCLLDRGISTRRGVMAIHHEVAYGGRAGWESRLSVTSRVAASTLILPLFHDMTEEEQDYVITSVECIARREMLAAAAASPLS
jgi:dTDP-4-amino-4,6-dideoxygalactose transaminase